MAGRTKSTRTADTDTATTTEDTMTDTAVAEAETDATETAVAEPNEAAATTESDSAEKAEKAPAYDIAPFNAELDKVLEGNVGSYDTEGLFDSVMAFYADGDRPAKTAISREMNNRVRDALIDPDKTKFAPGLGVVLKAIEAIKDAKSSKSGSGAGRGRPRVAVNPTELFVEKAASFQLAYAVLTAEGNLPEGLDADWQEQVSKAYQDSFAQVDSLFKYRNDSKAEGDAPEVNELAARAVKLAVRTSRTSVATGERSHNDVGKHIAEVAASMESGDSLTATEIANKSSEEYGESNPTRSAIVAYLNRENSAEALTELGLTVTGQGERGKLGVTKS